MEDKKETKMYFDKIANTIDEKDRCDSPLELEHLKNK